MTNKYILNIKSKENQRSDTNDNCVWNRRPIRICNRRNKYNDVRGD